MIFCGSVSKRMANAGLGEIRTSALRRTSPTEGHCRKGNKTAIGHQLIVVILNSFPYRLMVGQHTLTAPIVARVHVREPNI